MVRKSSAGFGSSLLTIGRKANDSFSAFVESKLFYTLTMVWFVVQSIFMALSTKFGLPPDEVYHFSLIKLFAQNGWSPILHSQSGYYFLGTVVHTPFFLYHYLLSLPFHLFASSGHAYLYLRGINICLAICSVLLVRRVARQLKVSALVQNLSIFMLTNTLMFVFLSASVSYDNLFILLSLVALSLLMSLWEVVDPVKLLALLVVLAAGMLVNVNFIPIAASIVGLLLYRYAKLWRLVLSKLFSGWQTNKVPYVALVTLIVLMSALFVQRYVGNVIAYHSYNPSCTSVLTLSQCEQSAIFRRTEYINANHVNAQVGPTSYLVQWIVMMSNWTFGILGLYAVYPLKFMRVWADLLLLLASVATVRYYDIKKWRFNVMAVVCTIYFSALLATNYLGYRSTGLINLAVQGRYLFAILPILYIFANAFILKWFSGVYSRLTYILLTLFIFATAGLPSYVILTDPTWHNAGATNLNHGLRDVLVRLYHL